MNISGKFDVTLNVLTPYYQGDGTTLGRMSIDKQFHGELQASSKGEMLTAMTSVKGSAGYVAIEQVSGTLSGKTGRFVLQHFGVMHDGKERLVLEVVPNSGTEQLVGLVGTMKIRIEAGQHFYDFDYSLP